MPYNGERANKAAHIDIIKNPEVATFLSQCEHLRTLGDADISAAIGGFKKLVLGGPSIPDYIIATDGSYYEASISNKFPSTKIGYLKFGTVLIRLNEYENLRVAGTHLVDPFRVAALEDGNRSTTLALPSSNVTLKGRASVQESFRYTVDSWFADNRTRIEDADETTSLLYTLRALYSLRDDSLSRENIEFNLPKCPTCADEKYRNFPIKSIGESNCPNPECKAPIFPTDCLRLWEEVSEFQSNGTAIGRLMNIVEHLLPVHYIRYLLRHNPEILGSMIFFVDGPLALFGTSAWLHRPIQKFLAHAEATLRQKGLSPPLIVGLQKSGQVVDFAQLMSANIEPSSILSISDDYRFKYILPARTAAKNCFGDETYYGQDFIYKTESGRVFVLGIPYPCSSKRPLTTFATLKDNTDSYPQLLRTLATIQTLESDLYNNAVVPIALAHKYTSISLAPGGRILDILSREIGQKP